MSVLFVALPAALLLGGSALVACIYCIRQGQYDDLESPPVRILIDDEDIVQNPSEPAKS
jgi:cbb3-type cytochrome oxidase maturation protein